MKKLKKILLIILLLVPLVGCQNQKNEWKEIYHLTYFYLKDCSNCQHFKKNVLPAIKKEFEHLVNAIKGEKLNEAAEIETYYYLKDGKVQKS